MSSPDHELEAQRQHIWGATLEEHLQELARRPHLARHLVATIREVGEVPPWPYEEADLLRCAIALIRVRGLLEEDET